MLLLKAAIGIALLLAITAFEAAIVWAIWNAIVPRSAHTAFIPAWIAVIGGVLLVSWRTVAAERKNSLPRNEEPK